jgi:hypothetical protein
MSVSARTVSRVCVGAPRVQHVLQRARVAPPRGGAPRRSVVCVTEIPEKALTVNYSINFNFEPFYRVVLKYSAWNDSENITRTVKRAVSIISLEDARRAVQEAEVRGAGIVLTTEEHEATLYAQRLAQSGLSACVEEA